MTLETAPNRRPRICIIAFKHVRECVHVLRQIDYLSRDFDLDVIGSGEPDPTWPPLRWHAIPEQSLTEKIAKLFWYLPGRVAPIMYDKWYWHTKRFSLAYEHAVASRADAYHANDWQSLPIAVMAAMQTGTPVVFHMHEYAEAERSELIWRLLVSPAIRYLTRTYTSRGRRRIAFYITVCNGIAKRYGRELGVDVDVIYNAPKPVSVRTCNDDLNPDQVRMIHHGYAMRGRGLHQLVEAVGLSDQRFVLDFMLMEFDRGYIDELKQLADRVAPGRVRFRHPVAPDEIVATVAEYDLGLCVIQPATYNQVMMLPNKLFEYIQAGLAVCVGPSPAMAELVQQHGVGVVTDGFAPRAIAERLNRLTASEIHQMKRSARQAAAVLNADVEMGKIVRTYHSLLADTAKAVV